MSEQNLPSIYNTFSADAVQHRTILRLEKVLYSTGLSRSVLYDLIKKGEFPRQRKISQKSIGWFSDEVQAFIDSRPVSD